MLTAELVNARRRGTELTVAKLGDDVRARALDLAARMLEILRAGTGSSRDDIEAALGAIDAAPREQRMRDGLAKLLEDRAEWTVASDLDPEEVRRELFGRSARARRALSADRSFDRGSVVAEAAVALGADASALEGALYSDLRGASLLTGFEAITPAALVDLYERSQAQAVLLRAVRIKIGVRCASPGAARSLFRRLKFLGLLHTIHPAPNGYEIVIDGPLSLFESVTKYGQKMALVVPVLEGCEAWTLEADVRWGKARTPLTFRASGGTDAPVVDEPPMPDDVRTLARSFAELGTAWKVVPGRVVLDLPGVGLSIPDLVFTRGRDKVYFEVLGFWSRDAVFRRVELVEGGLAEKILFAVSSRLRVSEGVLPEDSSGALYVYKGTMSARTVADRLERLATAKGLLSSPISSSSS